ncbi:hypothetical protein SUDANB105_03415 [Streptomyces sp. enrichment culture]
MTCPEHERFGTRYILTSGHVAEDDQVTKNLRENIPQCRELGILPQPFGSLYPGREVEEGGGMSRRNEGRPAGHRRLLECKAEAGDGGVSRVEFRSLVPVRLSS